MTATAAAPTRASVGLRSERGPVLGAIMLCSALVALDSTVIATAVPTIVKDLGGFSSFPWLFSIYLLAQAVTVPIYGKLADVVGRKPMITFGVSVFVLASLLCGVAWSMPALIASRALQGVGAGAIQPIGITMIGDLYTLEERAKVQGYVASVWGMSAVIGPALGGLLSEYSTWRWIFFINLPLGALALVTLRRRFVEKVERRSHTIDYTGAALLTTGCSLLILGLLEGGKAWPWRSLTTAFVLGGATVLLVVFRHVERRAAEPVLPLWMFHRRVLVSGFLVSLGVGGLIVGLSSYVPAYVQGVLGTGPIEAGFALAALTMGWPLAASVSGRLYLRLGFRDTALIGISIAIVGSLMTAHLSATSSVQAVAAAMFVTGCGMGLSASPTVVAVQSVVGWDRRGVVTGTTMFSRSMGAALGAATFGAIANATLADRFSHSPSALGIRSVDDTTRALAAGGPGADLARAALYAASHHVFVGIAVTTLLVAVAISCLPRRTELLTFD